MGLEMMFFFHLVLWCLHRGDEHLWIYLRIVLWIYLNLSEFIYLLTDPSWSYLFLCLFIWFINRIHLKIKIDGTDTKRYCRLVKGPYKPMSYMDRAMYFSITVYSPRAPKTMKNKGVGHLKTRWLTTKTSKNVGTLGARAHGIYLLPYPFKTNPSIPPRISPKSSRWRSVFVMSKRGPGSLVLVTPPYPPPKNKGRWGRMGGEWMEFVVVFF